MAEALLEGGAEILQFRHKGEFHREVFAEAELVRQLCEAADALFIIDDRADIARLLRAGVHVGQDDPRPADVRVVMGEQGIIGFSTHNRQQLAAAGEEPVDYLALGPVFSTSSKLNPDPVVGLDGLRQLRPLSSKPLVAIGGVTRENAREALAAGADSLAVIGDLIPRVVDKAQARKRAEEWIRLLGRQE